MSSVIAGVDPHKRSATIEVIDLREPALSQIRHRSRKVGPPSELVHPLAA
ncbi:hypothetical protein [Actinoplanes aureus]|uniref:Transposase n=1 Tax=Actinoplanes aureus TaxID=2792083 RepID=A0A931CG66_9ACTN|nr:hypothetical protein [Actinoplanes aureus]MBG0566962.1 hypothetical protein [Actinoplanes aureus]